MRKDDIGKGLVYGVAPPSAQEVEKAILGVIMMHQDAFDIVNDILKPAMFYVEAHQRIFTAMIDLNRERQPLEILTVADKLESNGDLEVVGGNFYLFKLTNDVVSSAYLTAYCHIVLDKFISREIIRICSEKIGEAYKQESKGVEILESFDREITSISSEVIQSETVWIDTVLVNAIKQIEHWRQMQTDITGVPTGFAFLDWATRGWQPNDFIVLAARPSVGKTAFALNLISNAGQSFHEQSLRDKKPCKSVAVFSLEMGSTSLGIRMLSASSETLLEKLNRGRMTDDEMKRLHREGAGKLAKYKIAFEDKPGLSLPKLKSRCRQMIRKNNLGLVVIDYLQLMKSGENNSVREQEISAISRGLKELAMELNIPIIALAQMSREFERRTGPARTPQMSDLRESGAIEQDADMIMFLWGPTNEDIAQDASLLTRRYIKIAKHRNGVLGQWDLDFKNEIQLFKVAEQIDNSFAPSGFRPVADVNNRIEPNRYSEDENPF